MILGGFDGKDCTAFAQFGDVEVHQRTYRRARQFVGEDLLQVLKPSKIARPAPGFAVLPT